jgi:hypothetical protein
MAYVIAVTGGCVVDHQCGPLEWALPVVLLVVAFVGLISAVGAWLRWRRRSRRDTGGGNAP